MTTTVENVTAKRRGRPVDPNSGLARARAVYATLPAGATRQEVIKSFQGISSADGKNMSKETAAAYYSVITGKAKSK